MKLKIYSILLLLAIISVITLTPSAFADHHAVIVSAPQGTSVPGCEETNECFIPAEVTIDVGGMVTWSNDDSAAHTVTGGSAADGPSGVFDSSLFMAATTFSHTFEEAGEYPYFCMVHPWMMGMVVVQEAGLGEKMMEEEIHEEEMMEEKMEMEKMMVANIDVTMSPPIQGSVDAEITIIEFGDYQCPKCDLWFQNEKPTIKSDYIDTGKAKLYFVDFPWLGEDSDSTANASYCADDQGKFWEYHKALYDNQGGINEGWANADALKQFAEDLSFDVDVFTDCIDSNKYADRVSYNTKVGSSLGVEGTPTFFIVDSEGNTERIDGPQSSDIFAEVIDAMLGETMVEAMAQEEEDETMEEEMMETEVMDEGEGGGCLIATAAYGSELAPQVQLLREIRDNTVMSTESGTAFMTGFNQLYYSFSPTIADMERENPAFQEVVRVFITPMMSTLSIMTFADDGNEAQVLGLGISVIALNIGMYIAAPAAVGFTLSKRLKTKSP